MVQKYPKSEQQKTKSFENIPFYMSWGDGTAIQKKQAFEEMNRAVDEFTGVKHQTQGSYYYDYSDLDTNTSGRPGLTKSDYYKFRPGEKPPSLRNYKEIIKKCDYVYQTVGLIRNIIDLMGDFACQGIRIVHPNKRIERFFKNWFNKVNGVDRSERFCNNLFRTGNVVVKRGIAKVTTKVQETLYQAVATPDMEVPITKSVPKEIPFKYTFLDPSTIDVVAGPLASFASQQIYTINLSPALRRIIQSPTSEEERQIVNNLPQDIILSAKSNKPYVLSADKVRVFNYKKDDWQTWAYPIIYAILDDVSVLEKLRLADMAALDGAISNIRIFKLGNLEYKIAPSRTAASKLANILQNNVGGGTIDLIWGPDLEFIESKSTVHQFLGEEKYRPHLSAIYNGLGIPPTLTGGGGTGTTNNYISLKTLIQRLEYARKKLLSFWTQELADVQKAMGFRFPAKIEFDIDILDDEQATKALLVQLVDRSLISDELLQLRFGHDPDMESVRINREQKDRDSGKKVTKAGPYYDPQFGIALKKVALQTGVVSPSQVGLSEDAVIPDMLISKKSKGEKTALEMRQPPGLGKPPGPPAAPKGIPQQGRPKNSKDTIKRKTKTFKPKLRANVEVWLKNAQGVITETLNDVFLDMFKKKNFRMLTTAETKQVEKLKFGVLFNLEPLTIVSSTSIYNALNKPLDYNLYQSYQAWATNISQELDRPLTLDEFKQIQITLYSNTYIDTEI